MKPVIVLLGLAACSAPPPRAVPELASTLRDTGLYADWTTRTLAAGTRPFTPQYPLWSDGASKARWIQLPPGTSIDASDRDAWQFPVGTKLWKELSFGRRVETRYMERTHDGWRYATYVWADDQSEARLAPPEGVLATAEVAAGTRHAIPSEADCRVCHGNGPAPVLGFSALQLSPDRDPRAPHRETPDVDAIDLDDLIATGAIRGLPGSLAPPRIEARSPTERAALGYLHGNCGGCHRAAGALGSVGLVLSYSLASPTARHDVLVTLVDTPSHVAAGIRVAPGEPSRSVLVDRLRSRQPAAQMPPLATQLVDHDASNLIASWIAGLAEPAPHNPGETP